MVPKNPSIPSWKLAVCNIQHKFFSLSDVTPEISHWRADVGIGGRQGQRHRNLRETFPLSLFVVNADCNKKWLTTQVSVFQIDIMVHN
jgi:hypothetical protein